MSTDEIDALLERYLHLLDQYTVLRGELSTLQSSIHQDIARANFSSDRGLRYGRDHYDSRMRASCLVQLNPSEVNPFQLKPTETTPTSSPPVTTFTIQTTIPAIESTAKAKEATQSAETSKETSSTPRNPITMFGILVPPPLRSVQKSAVAMVERVVPRLVNVDAEMRELEICIRRARKYHRREQTRKSMTDHLSAPEDGATGDGLSSSGVSTDGPALRQVEA